MTPNFRESISQTYTSIKFTIVWALEQQHLNLPNRRENEINHIIRGFNALNFRESINQTYTSIKFEIWWAWQQLMR